MCGWQSGGWVTHGGGGGRSGTETLYGEISVDELVVGESDAKKRLS